MLTDNFKEDLAAYLRKLAGIHSVGELWFGIDPKSKPAGVVLYSGQTLERSLYADHWEYIQNKRTIVSEEEWQAKVTSDGFCPFYSTGNGTSTYRMPLVEGVHPRFVAALQEVGEYTEAGLPNITGIQPLRWNSTLGHAGSQPLGGGESGALYRTTDPVDSQVTYSNSTSTAGNKVSNTLGFDASRSNEIYGNSDTVTPPSVNVIVGEYVVSTQSIYSNTTQNILDRLESLEDRTKLLIGTPDGQLLLNGLPIAVLSNNRLKLKDTASALGAQTSDVWHSGAVEYFDKNDTRVAGIQPKFLQNGEMELVLNAYSASGYSNFVIRSDGSLSFKGKDVEALALPSKKWVDLSLGTSGTVYTAPDNGWVYWRKRATGSGQFIALYAYLSNGSAYEAGVAWSIGSHDLYTSIPIRKGEKFLINYSAAGTATPDFLRFIYAYGSK